MKRTWTAAIIFVFVALSSSGCGSDDANPFILEINSVDVVELAVSSVIILMEPAGLDQDFASTALMDRGDGVFTETVVGPTGSSAYRIRLETEYITAHTRPGPSTFILDVPLQTSAQEDPTIGNPRVLVTFRRGTADIGIGERQIEWPLPAGGRAEIRVVCLMTTRLECTNNDPLVDAGM